MAPKKQNGFMIFTLDWKEKHGRNMNIAQATSAAGAIWSKMTPKEREPYLQRAKAEPVSGRSRTPLKLTCLGTPLNLIEKENEDKEKLQKEMLKTIEKTVQLAVNGNKLINEKFYFIMVNYFTRLLNSDIYIPAEIAIVEFSLIDGVSRKYHVLVNPDIDLYGNVYEAQNHSDTTHKLPLPPNAIGESDMQKIALNILEFVLNTEMDSYPPLYTYNNAISIVSSALSFLANEAGAEGNDLSNFSVYPIQELFYALKCGACDMSSVCKPKNQFISNAYLDRDVFEYAHNIACQYHEDIDRSNYCALSHVNRWGFYFVDYMAKDLSITLIPGRHMPDTVNATMLMESSNSFVEEKSINGVCSRVSALSLESKYQSFDSFDQKSLVSNHKPSTSRAMPKPMTPKRTIRANDTVTDLRDSLFESSYNPWARHDDSKPPDSRFFSIDYEADDDHSSLNVSRRRVRGRGIAVLDDIKPT